MTMTTTSPPRGRRRATPPEYEPIVAYDPQRSTRWTNVYRAQSSRHREVYYDVRHDTRAGVWACTCPATVAQCRHIREGKTHELRAWWLHLLCECPPAELARLLAVAEGRGEHTTPDDVAMAHACRALLGQARVRA